MRRRKSVCFLLLALGIVSKFSGAFVAPQSNVFVKFDISTIGGDKSSLSKKKKRKRFLTARDETSSGITEVPLNVTDDTPLKDFFKDEWFKKATNEGNKAALLCLTLGEIKAQKAVIRYAREDLVIDVEEFVFNRTVIFLRKPVVAERMVPADYGLGTKLAHNEDLEALRERISEIEKWHTDDITRKKYLAPLLAMVQSSGTGKSKLVYELSRRRPTLRSILLRRDESNNDTKEKSKFDRVLTLERWNEDNRKKLGANLRNVVFEECLMAEKEEMASRADASQGLLPIVLVFDEAQHLISTGDGFLLRVLRWITRENPASREESAWQRFQISVVVTGTSSTLRNYFPENEPEPTGSTRYLDVKGGYLPSGTALFDPFFRLCTMGCLATGKVVGRPTEYERAIRYGRPLFEVMYQGGKLNEGAEFDIVNKMLLGAETDSWEKNLRSCMSILGTRVQMGRTSEAVVSDLVSRGYAHLTYFDQENNKYDSRLPNVASFTFFPDPVCARLAACLMDKDWRTSGEIPQRDDSSYVQPQFSGRDKTFWTSRLSDIYTTGLCSVDKGDFGEMAVALYLLFCGDLLRKEKDDQYRTLSVDLDSWLSVAASMGSNVDISKMNGNRSVSCIQVYRNQLRFDTMKYGDNSFLKELYEMGCGVYCPTQEKGFDIVLPIRVVDTIKGEDPSYVPMFINVKNHAYMAPGDAAEHLEKLVKTVHQEGVHSGLCLLCVVGQDRKDVRGSNYENLLGTDVSGEVEKLKVGDGVNPSSDVRKVGTHLVPKLLCIHKDEFGIHDAILATTPGANQISEIYESHSQLLRLPENCMQENVLRSGANKDDKRYFERICGAVTRTQATQGAKNSTED